MIKWGFLLYEATSVPATEGVYIIKRRHAAWSPLRARQKAEVNAEGSVRQLNTEEFAKKPGKNTLKFSKPEEIGESKVHRMSVQPVVSSGFSEELCNLSST